MFEKLGDHNWPLWKYKIGLVLGEKGLSDVVKGNVPVAPTKDWLQRDGMAQSVIGLALEDSQLCHVMEKGSAKEMWDSLQQYHERRSMCGKVFLLRRVLSLRLAEDGSMADHLSQIAMLISRLVSIGEKMADHWLVAIILSSLPESYNMLIMSFESRAEDELTLDFVKGRLLDEWRRRCEENRLPEQSQKVLLSGKPKQKCHYCGKEGHFRRDCRKLKQDQEKRRSDEGYEESNARRSDYRQKANKVESVNEEVCFGLFDKAVGDVWYLDSGCTSHMTGDATNLSFEDTTRREMICLADGNQVLSEGIGEVKIDAENGDGKSVNLTVHHVLHVPALKNNLLSVSKITDEGFEVVFRKSGCSIMKEEKVIVSGERYGNLYRLKKQRERSMLADACHRNGCQHIWHRRLGHRNHEDINRIIREDLGEDLIIRDCGIRSVCTTCYQGKLTRVPFPKHSVSKTKEKLDLVHSDLCGQMEVTTPGGKRYVLTLIDDYSRYCTVYLLEQKSQTAECIEQFIKLMQTQFGKVPKAIRTDGGGEYSGYAFKNMLRSYGVELQQTAPYSPQQNGQAERKNRSLIEMSRCMLIEANMNKRYWGEAVSTANYLLNRLPAAATGRTPYEVWYGKKPSYSHLKVFGSPAYVHLPKERRRKLDEKSARLVFVGYAEGRKAYRFLNPETDTVIISRDAKFCEELTGQETIRNVVPVGAVSISRENNGSREEVVPGTEEPVEVPQSYVGGPLQREDTVPVLDSSLEYGSAESHVEDIEERECTVRRSKRANKGKAPVRLIEEVNAMSGQEEFEPSTYNEAANCEMKDQWLKAMKEELNSHQELRTWELTELPAGQKLVGSRWIYKIKKDASGQIVKRKARLVAQGFNQQPGIDFVDAYAPVAKQATLKALLAIASERKMVLKHLDIKTAYLNGSLKEVVYMRQPPGFSEPGNEALVCRLRKSIYGLRQSAKCWNDRFDEALKEMGFHPTVADPCLYTRERNKKRVYIVVYVDDVVVASEDESELESVYHEFSKHFETTELGQLKYFLGLEVERDKNGVYSVSLQGYIQQTAERFGLGDSKPVRTPMDEQYAHGDSEEGLLPNNIDYRSLVGALLYIAVNARPDIAAAVSVLGRKVNHPSQADWVAAKRVVRYLRGTAERRIEFSGTSLELIGFVDADWAGDHATRKSNSGYVFLMCGAAISWKSQQQTLVALSSMESEYIALCEATREAIWLRQLLLDLGVPQLNPTVLFEDNQSCIAFVRSQRISKRTKHISVREMFVKDSCDKGIVQLQYMCTEEMIADVLTKPIGPTKMIKFSTAMGLA